MPPKNILFKEDVMGMITKAFEEYGFDNFKALETGSLIAVMWRSGARVSEILAIKKKDIKLTQDYLYINFRTLKRRKELYRNLPFKLYDDKDKNFFNRLIIEHTKKIEANHLVWEMHRDTAHSRIKKLNPNAFPNLFRHSLNTILADNGMSDSQLKQWNGWAEKSNMPAQYVNQSQIRLKPISMIMDGV